MAEETYICSHCGQIFPGTSALMVHERTHVGDQMCKCSQCERTYPCHSDHLIHQKNHAGGEPRRCALDCGKGSSHNAPLPPHQGAFRAEKPFSSSRTTAEVSWQSIRQEDGKMAGARGLSWRRDETLDLLSIWGEKGIQTALRESHRNKDIFGDVAKKMAERGHRRSAEECRTKTKGLRLAYKRVLADKTGNSLVTCPYYEILDRILKGDPSVKTKRVSQTVHRETVSRTEDPPPPENTINLYPLIEEEKGKVKEEAPSTSSTQDVPSDASRHVEESPVEYPEETKINEAVLEGPVARNNKEKKIPEGLERRNPVDIPPGVTLADLSPSSRLALQRAKRKRVSAIQRVGEMMLQQSSREHRAMLEAGRKESELFLQEMRAARQQEKEGTDTMCSLFREALTTLKDISRAMMQSWSGVAQERVQGPEQEHEFEAQPSDLGLGQPTLVKIEEWPSASGVGQPTWGEFEERPSTSGVGQPELGEFEAQPSTVGMGRPIQEDTLVHSPVAVTPPSPVATSSPTGRSSGSLVMRGASRYQPRTLAGYRARRLAKAKKPYSPRD